MHEIWTMVIVWWLICAMSYYHAFGAKRRKAPRDNPPNGHFSCFRMTTFRPATWNLNDTFHASPYRLLFVVSLPGGAKGRHAKTGQNHHLACFRIATFRPARRRYDTFINGKISRSICRVFAWRGERSPRENTPRLSVKCTYNNI